MPRGGAPNAPKDRSRGSDGLQGLEAGDPSCAVQPTEARDGQCREGCLQWPCRIVVSRATVDGLTPNGVAGCLSPAP